MDDAATVLSILRRLLSAHYDGTQSLLADALGVNRATTSRWFKHGSVPEYAAMERLCALHPDIAAELRAAWAAESKEADRRRRVPVAAPTQVPAGDVPPHIAAALARIEAALRAAPAGEWVEDWVVGLEAAAARKRIT